MNTLPSVSPQRPANGMPGDRELLGRTGDDIVTATLLPQTPFRWHSDRIGCPPVRRPLARAIVSPSRGAHPDQVGLEFGEDRQILEERPAHWVGRMSLINDTHAVALICNIDIGG